jgi:hypothetical protein
MLPGEVTIAIQGAQQVKTGSFEKNHYHLRLLRECVLPTEELVTTLTELK